MQGQCRLAEEVHRDGERQGRHREPPRHYTPGPPPLGCAHLVANRAGENILAHSISIASRYLLCIRSIRAVGMAIIILPMLFGWNLTHF